MQVHCTLYTKDLGVIFDHIEKADRSASAIQMERIVPKSRVYLTVEGVVANYIISTCIFVAF